MSEEQNKALVRRLYEASSRGDLAAFDEILIPAFVDHNPDPGQPPGREGVKKGFTTFRSAFPDFEMRVEDMLAEGDKVAARVTVTGTHRGQFQGIAPTGRRVTIGVIDIIRCQGGKCVERWGVVDALAMMQQLGVVSAPK